MASALDALRGRVGGRDAVALSAGELVAVSEAFGVLRRTVDAAYMPVVAEINRLSGREWGRDSLAKKNGFASPIALISAATGVTSGEAARLVAVGEATASRTTLTGEPLPARYPFVADALSAGHLGAAAAQAIIGMLTRVALRADHGACREVERTLVDAAPGLTLEQLQRLILRAEAHLDPDGVAPREEELRADRSLTIRQDRSGMVTFTGRFDPETAAPIKTAIEALVGGMLNRRDAAAAGDASSASDAACVGAVSGDTGAAGVSGSLGASGSPGASGASGSPGASGAGADASHGLGGLDVGDRRTIRQMQADALADLCRHGLGCAQVPTGVSTTVVVRMTLADLDAGTGYATIDGIDQPVSVGAVRRMAADAQVIPCVLGGDSEILDWGRTKRLFTPAQKLALAERDGGCAFCGHPPSFTVAHHILWWLRDTGPTDLSNGILLCVACHHRVHDDGWDIRIDGTGVTARVWFIPPAWLDPSRTPRLGGRARYDLTA